MNDSHKNACTVLEKTQGQIPEEAIETLRNAPDSQSLTDRIVQELRFAYTKEYASDAPLFFAVVAEEHLSEKLIDPVIQLFVTQEETFWPLTLQGEYLLGALAEKFPEKVADKVLSILESEVENASMMPYYSLFEALYFIDLDANADRILKLYSDEDLSYVKYLSKVLADRGMKQALPVMKEWRRKYEKKPGRYGSVQDAKVPGSFEEYIGLLENEQAEFPGANEAYCRKRGEWKPFLQAAFNELYKQHDNLRQLSEFWNEEDEESTERANTPPDVMEKAGPSKAKIGRNDPCPCGSGKKYKHCCMGKYSF